jgi:hypothetical protein
LGVTELAMLLARLCFSQGVLVRPVQVRRALPCFVWTLEVDDGVFVSSADRRQEIRLLIGFLFS